jgi:phosphoadenosine phosphosulfate reductase
MSRDPLGQAQSILAAAFDGGARTCLTCSFQAEDVAVLHLARVVRSDVPVLFLDTGYHFAEVYEYRDRIAKDWGFEVVNLAPRQSVAEQESTFGILHQSDPARCCHLRKVEPLMEGLAGFDNWLTGLRREQSPTRANLQPEEHHRFPNGLSLRKFSPLYDWTWSEVLSYLAANDIPLLPLYDQGYPSVGCEPCTSKPEDGAHSRSGRWGGRKLECGLHTVTVKED